MRAALSRAFLSFLVLTLVCRGATQPATAPAEQVFFPLNVLETHVAMEKGDIPVLSLGVLPEEPSPNSRVDLRGPDRWDNFPHGEAKAIPALLARPSSLGYPVGGKPLAILLAAPYRDLAYHWQPTSITLAGTTLTVHVDEWADTQTDRSKNFSRHELFLIAVPPLEAGRYTLALSVRKLSAYPDDAQFYTYNDDSLASIPLLVKDPGVDSRASTEAVRIAAADLKPQHRRDNENRALTLYQPPLHMVRAADEAHGEPWWEVGKLDAYKLIKDSEEGEAGLHRPPHPVATTSVEDLCVVIAGPTLNSDESFRLEEIAWRNRTCTIRVSVWRAEGRRAANVLSQPFFLVPLCVPQSVLKNDEPLQPAIQVQLDYVAYRDSATPAHRYKRLPFNDPATYVSQPAPLKLKR